MKLAIPEKRKAVLYVRIQPANKKFVEKMAAYHDISEAAYLDHILDKLRKNDSIKRNIRKSSK